MTNPTTFFRILYGGNPSALLMALDDKDVVKQNPDGSFYCVRLERDRLIREPVFPSTAAAWEQLKTLMIADHERMLEALAVATLNDSQVAKVPIWWAWSLT